MRLFIALDFGRDSKDRLHDIGMRCKEAGIAGRYTAPSNLHLTVKFLGETRERRIPDIQRLLDTAAGASCAFNMQFDGLGTFGERILWVSVKRNEILESLREEVEQKMAEIGFSRETRPFSPHITIARDISYSKNEGLIKIHPFETEIREISLMESIRIDGKLVYKNLYRAKLSKANQ